MGRLADLDERVLDALRISSAVRYTRQHARGYVAALFASAAAAGGLSVLSSAIPVLVVAGLLGLSYMAGTLLLVLVVTDDMNAQGRAGGVWGLAVLVLGPLVGILWLTVRDQGR